MSKLKPCPFCGGKANFGTVKYQAKSDVVELNHQDVFHFVSCELCGSENKGLVGYRDQESAQNHWNTRQS